MARTVAIGIDSFDTIIKDNIFYIDKTHFIKEWWESKDKVTLIARPRRFGKTLNMSMLETFFSNKYKNCSELFENLDIWKDEYYRNLQGFYPVISISFANVKETDYDTAVYRICQILQRLYSENLYLMESEKLSDIEKKKILKQSDNIEEKDAVMAINDLASYLMKHFSKKVIILLDEYDTPMQEAYVNGYWDEFTSFIRGLFNSTFKTNPYLERAILTGITRVSKEFVFSDLNNLSVITTTSKRYATAFGFTEQEVFAAMDEQGLTDKENVKAWYDGFVFGNISDIYNPWSIINYLKDGYIGIYWANTSSNSLIGKLIREGSPNIKELFEKLLRKDYIEVSVDEQIVYNTLDTDESAVWSLLLATGYLKVLEFQTDEQSADSEYPIFKLAITNEEVRRMFYRMIKGWFGGKIKNNYNNFMAALIEGDLEAMNEYMENVTLQMFSYFDTSEKSEKNEPERFYHGFVLGLIVNMSEKYIIKSNRESGFGRYDIMMYPKDISTGDGIIIEFKVRKKKREADLEETVRAALKQIEDKNYEAELMALGFKKENIRKYGFAFEGKKVLIGEP